ncbi:MAG: 4a-hydroxytetrahydrobiopterin dehydratase [Euryarchaeota archaeon]|nr:4a-hydroxytetrahydrobiopterin dehydratase [Euryarchaeota archaeon]
MARRTLLTEEEITAHMAEIPKWTWKGNYIERTWKFKDFRQALAFINKVGELAEEMNHHPDIYNSWATVRFRLTTHDRGGLTALDFELAKKIDAL